jgi:hypothetical protein
MKANNQYFLPGRDRALTILLGIAFIAMPISVFARQTPLIADHTTTNLGRIPSYWVEQAKANLRLSYGHTSHGSQIVSGMGVLMADPLYSFNTNGAVTSGVLSLADYTPSGDLGSPDRTSWATRTRTYLNTPGNNRNVVVWSWCGQAASASESEMATYLDLMNQLEIDFPDVTFIYMTGHLDGSGVDGQLNQRNQQIRNYVIANNKVLFDFADIESFDPDGNEFLSLDANDGCYYNGGNWATEWCAANPGSALCQSCSCAHSLALNCNLKARAFWWLLARLAGWSGHSNPYDSDLDSKSDYWIVRPSTGEWYVKESNSIGGYSVTKWGVDTDIPVAADYDGDGKADVAMWRPGAGVWYLLPSNSPGTYTAVQWGLSTDIPVPADYDGDGKADVAVWRSDSGFWYILTSSSAGAYSSVPWGLSGDVPVPNDYDGDGITDIAVWRSGNGFWYVLPSASPGTYIASAWGIATDKPVPADYDQDGKADIAVWRSSDGNWYILPSNTPGSYSSTPWGTSTDIPAPGDYDGDGSADIAVWRPGTGMWYVLPSAAPGSYTGIHWGTDGDLPITSATGILHSLP